MKKIIGLISVGCILAATNGFAVNRSGDVTLTLGGGYYYFAEKRHLDNVVVPNIALAYNFSERWAIEGLVGVINTNQKQQPLYDQSQGVHGFVYTIDGIYRFLPHNRFQPYVLAGVGALSLKPNGNDSVHQGNINAGLGAQLFFSPSIALRGEIKDIYTMVGGKNDVMINFGVSFLFGGDEKPVETTYKT